MQKFRCRSSVSQHTAKRERTKNLPKTLNDHYLMADPTTLIAFLIHCFFPHYEPKYPNVEKYGGLSTLKYTLVFFTFEFLNKFKSTIITLQDHLMSKLSKLKTQLTD